MNIDQRVMNIKNNENEEELNDLLNEYQSFVLKTASDIKNAYIDVDNDDEFVIAMMAFSEAVERYDMEKGPFLSFARLLISSRLKNYWNKNRETSVEYDENIMTSERNNVSRTEIVYFMESLKEFNITAADLADDKPRYKETIEKIKEVAKLIAEDKKTVEEVYKKKRLPQSVIVRKFGVSRKFLRRNQKHLIAYVVIIREEYEEIRSFLL